MKNKLFIDEKGNGIHEENHYKLLMFKDEFLRDIDKYYISLNHDGVLSFHKYDELSSNKQVTINFNNSTISSIFNTTVSTLTTSEYIYLKLRFT